MPLNVRKEYNILNECKYIRNRDRCINDTNTGYEVFFNRGVDGWTSYDGLEVSYTEGHFLWCVVNNPECSIGRDSDFIETFEADYFGDFEVDMLINTDDKMTPDAPTTFTARLEWKMTTDIVSWHQDSYSEFEVEADGEWHRYRINLLEKQRWVGECNNFKFYPTVDGVKNLEIAIRRFAFRSDYNYKCKQPACAGHRGYSHPCPYTGTHARAYSGIRKPTVSIDDNNSRLGVSIDGYSPKYIDLDLSHATDPWTVAQSITMKLNSIGVGGYKFAECKYDPIEQNFSIYSGTKGKSGSVAIYHGGEKDVGEELGFLYSSGLANWRAEPGQDPADGYSPNYYKLPATLLYRLPNSTTTIIDYDPKDPLIEIGRDDVRKLPMDTVFPEGYILGLLMVDIFGGCSYEGIINKLWYRGEIASYETDEISKIFLLRPTSDNTYLVVNSITVEDGYWERGLFRADVNWNVRPGDVFGLWQCLPAIHGVDYLEPDKLYKYSWVEKIEPHLEVGDEVLYGNEDIRFYGYESLPVYGFSDKRMLDIGIESELKYEYGVSHVALIGEPDSDYITMNLTDLDSTLVTITTEEGQVGPVPATQTDYFIDADALADYFYIDFWFPGVIKYVCRMRTFFNDQHNLRGFCWEWYVEPEDRVGFTWGAQEPGIETYAPQYGSEAGWHRLVNPVKVRLDDERDVTYDSYLMWNYVTDDPEDYYPGLTEEEQSARLSAARGAYWNQLDQLYGGINTRGVRLNCWKAASADINDIEIYCVFPSTKSLLHSVEVMGISGPLVFDTEKYDIINIEGEKYSSSNISRVQTPDYLFGMEFSLEEDDVIVAPVGTTMSKIQVDIGGLPAKIEQIKVIPQRLAVQVKGEGDEPIEEISDLSWGMPSEGQDWTYGPSKKYTVCNDRGHEAKLLLGVANPLAVDQACVFYSPLSSYESLSDPIRGLTAKLIESPDYIYSNSRGINYRSIVYSVLPQDPVNWYSSTNSGVVWQTLISGSPFTSTTLWSEPENPNATEWKLYNWARTEDVSVTSGSLSMSVDSMPLDVEHYQWKNPTYFQSLSKVDSLIVETQLNGFITKYNNVDSSAGLVLFDNQDRTKFIRIERYMGNNITASGFTQYHVPHGDYISYGESSQYTESGGFTVLDLAQNKKTNMLLKMSKEQDRVEIAYKTPWDGWTTASSLKITDWSDDLRMGLFVGAVDRTREASEQVVKAAFNYLSYRRSNARQTEFFDYEFDFENFEYTRGLWTAHNLEKAERLETSSSGIHLINYIGGGAYSYFNKYVQTPALEIDWGGTRDTGAVLFRLTGYDSNMLASGSYTAGVLLRDTNWNENYIQVGLRRNNLLEVSRTGGVVDNFWLPEVVQPASGIWLRLYKTSGMYAPSYSYDGFNFTAISGYRLTSWSDSHPVSMVFSSDLPEVRFDSLQVGTSQAGANKLAAEFEPEICLYNVWGRKHPWDNIQYTTSGTLSGWASEKPDNLKFISFEKSISEEIDLGSVKFIPDPWVTKKVGKSSSTIFEVKSAMELLFDRKSKIRPEVSQTTSSGSWPVSSASSKGMPQYDYPILIVDLGRTYEIGRCPRAAENAKGKFSRSITSIVDEVEWAGQSADISGFDRKCLLSSSQDQCTADKVFGKPIMTFTDGERKMKYYAGPCDGLSTPAGKTYHACPLYSLGQARWMLLEWDNYEDITISGGSIWFFGAISGHPKGGDYRVTEFNPWWVTDFGEINWLHEGNHGHSVVYSYPGLNSEGSCFFNGTGSEYWRLAPDKNWTYEDGFSIDLKAWQPENIDSLLVRVGRDRRCYYEFTVTGTISESWSTHSWLFKDSERVIQSMEGLEEPFYTISDDEYYMINSLPYSPLPYINTGYVEVTASGRRSDIYFKDLTNTRTRFVDNMLFLGINESLYIPNLDLLNTGTIELDYYPSEAAVNLVGGDPRDFFYSIFTISNNQAGFSVVLHPYWGWNVYCHTPMEKYRSSFLPVFSEAVRMLPTREASGPFHLVLTWAADGIPGRTDNVVLWVDGGEACSESMDTLVTYFDKNDVKLTLGRGTQVFDLEEKSKLEWASYGKYANLKVYKHAVPFPNAEIDNEAAIPENLLELSLDETNWASFTQGNLPLISTNVQHGECVDFYMRNKRPRRDIKALHKRHTAYLSAMWEVNSS